jgi:mRNA interferase MazF
MYKFGTIILVPFPFTDLSLQKLRPGLIISNSSPEDEDICVAFITSQKKHIKNSFEISSQDIFFSETGLKSTSQVRLDKIATLSKNIILGELGRLPLNILKEKKENFYKIFGF